MHTITLWIEAFPQLLAATAKVTIPLSLVSFVIALLLGIATAQLRLSKLAAARSIAWLYVWIFRGTPVLVQLFIVFYGLPKLGVSFSPWTAAIVTFSLNSGAYIAAVSYTHLTLPTTERV